MKDIIISDRADEKNNDIILSISNSEVMKLLEICECVLEQGMYDEKMRDVMFKVWTLAKEAKKNGFAIYEDICSSSCEELFEEDDKREDNKWGFPDSSSPFKTNDMSVSVVTELEMEPGIEYELPELELFHSKKK